MILDLQGELTRKGADGAPGGGGQPRAAEDVVGKLERELRRHESTIDLLQARCAARDSGDERVVELERLVSHKDGVIEQLSSRVDVLNAFAETAHHAAEDLAPAEDAAQNRAALERCESERAELRRGIDQRDRRIRELVAQPKPAAAGASSGHDAVLRQGLADKNQRIAKLESDLRLAIARPPVVMAAPMQPPPQPAGPDEAVCVRCVLIYFGVLYLEGF
jgi:predicted RNase H-like nuclease (RuvC/YqgF family)